MRTNIDIDDDLIARAMAVTGLATKKDAVAAGLQALIDDKGRADLRDLRGKVRFAEGYDYKALREGHAA
jgi:Arc/MetJ family transcription regulator